MNCPNCSSELVPGENSALLQCRDCNIWLPAGSRGLTRASGSSAAPSPTAPPLPKRKVSLPAKFKVNPSAREFELRWRWWGGFSWFWLVFAGIWNLITLPMTVMMLLEGEFGFELLFMAPFMLVGAATGYLALAYLLNSSRLSVTRGELTLSHGPLPYGGKTYPARRLEQLFCQQYEAGQVNHRPVYAFRVQVLLREGGQEVLVSGLDTLEEALYLERQIEERLNIEDRPVSGEYGS